MTQTTLRMVGTLLVTLGVAGLVLSLPLPDGQPSGSLDRTMGLPEERPWEALSTIGPDDASGGQAFVEMNIEPAALASADEWPGAEGLDAAPRADEEGPGEDEVLPDGEDWPEAGSAETLAEIDE